jgi:enamine deaminase RidA (YjgF/YER057c/UK114 family)
MNAFECRIVELNLEIPVPLPSIANFVPFAIAGNLIYVSGQIPIKDGRPSFIGKLGRELGVEEGMLAARTCALQVIGVVRHACNADLSKIRRCIRLGGFVNCVPEFADQPQVMNGASDLIVSIFGEMGRHARVAVGVNSLPCGVAVEVDAIFELDRR